MDERNEGQGAQSAQAMVAMLPAAVADEVVRALGGRMDASRSPEQGELVKALCAARPKFGVVERSRTAKVTPREGKGSPYTYDYSTLSDAIAATTDALAEQELAVFQDFEQGASEIVIITELAHSSGQWRRSRLSMPVSRDAGPQQIGSAITYGRRYARMALLDLAPADDDDGQAAQKGMGREEAAAAEGGISAEELHSIAKSDPQAAFAAVRRAVASAMGCGDISEARYGRLVTIADRERGWKREQVDQACQRHLGVAAQKIPWKAYELVVELFRVVGPQAFAAPSQSERPAAGSPPAGGGTDPAPVADDAPPPVWADVWQKIREGFDDLTPEALGDPIGAQMLPAVMEGFGRNGWTPVQVEAVVRGELKVSPAELPKDGTHPPVFRMIAKALRLFKPTDLSAGDWERYDVAPSAAPPSVEDVLAPLAGDIPLPEIAEDAWARLRVVFDALAQHHQEAMVPMTPDDRLTLYGQKARNGNRNSGDVVAVIFHYLGIAAERLPAVLFPHVLRIFASYPVRTSGCEEVLSRLPVDPRKPKVQELADLCHELIRLGFLTEDEVARTGAGGKVSKDDLIAAIEKVRERALLEAGHA